MAETAELGAATELEARNRDIVRALYKLTGRGRWDAAAEFIAPDLVIRQANSLPFAGEYHGLEGLRTLFATVVETIGIRGVEYVQMTAGGDWVVSLLVLLADSEPPVRLRMAETFRLRDGKVVEIVPYYFDAALVRQVAESRRRASRG